MPVLPIFSLSCLSQEITNVINISSRQQVMYSVFFAVHFAEVLKIYDEKYLHLIGNGKIEGGLSSKKQYMNKMCFHGSFGGD